MCDSTSSTTSVQLHGSTGHLCIGCGRRPVEIRRTYCKLCKFRLAGGGACDIDDIPTVRELQEAIGVSEEPSFPTYGGGKRLKRKKP